MAEARPPSPADGAPPPVRFEQATKRFGDLTALDHLDLEVGRGEIVGLLGPNGAGKTTALRLLLGLIRASDGRAEIFGVNAWRHPVAAHRHQAFIPGEFHVWPQLTGWQMLDLLGTVSGGYDEVVRDELIERFRFDPSKRGRTYSKGNRQKIAVIAALMVGPPLLVMDEPSSGLDPLMTATFQQCLREAKEAGRTVLLSSHVLSEVEAVCDRVAVLNEGVLVEHGTLDQLRLLGSRTVEAVFDGDPPEVDRVPGVQEVESADGVLRLRLSGAPGPLLEALSAAEPLSVDIREPRLEELFHIFYDEQARRDAHVARTHTDAGGSADQRAAPADGAARPRPDGDRADPQGRR